MVESEPPRNPKQIQGEQTRQRIVQAAAELFVSKGFKGTSISDLAQAMDLTKGAIYYHFESKNALFFAVIQMVRETWSKNVIHDVLKTKNALDRIAALLDNHTRLVSKDETVCLVMSSLISDTDFDDKESEFAVALRAVYAELITLIEHIVQRGQATGEIRPDLDARLVALNVVGIMRSSCCCMLDQFDMSFASRMETLRQILVAGLRC